MKTSSMRNTRARIKLDHRYDPKCILNSREETTRNCRQTSGRMLISRGAIYHLCYWILSGPSSMVFLAFRIRPHTVLDFQLNVQSYPLAAIIPSRKEIMKIRDRKYFAPFCVELLFSV